MALFDGMAKIYVRACVEAHRAWCQDLSPSTVSSKRLVLIGRESL